VFSPDGFLSDRHLSPRQKDMIRKAIAYMQANVENLIDVASVASYLGISSSHFCTLFLEVIGCSPGDYLITLRLERAKRYLAHSHMSVTNVCTKLGYTPSHFSRLFKRYIGCTSRQFVQQTQARNAAFLRRPFP
jgi:transcriptional regulator GlxA family with amidase domain